MVTKKLPFPGPDLRDIIFGHMQEPPPHPASLNPRVTPALAGVILRALAKRPDERFQSMADLDRALAEASASAPAPVAQAPVFEAPVTERPPVLPMMRIPVEADSLADNVVAETVLAVAPVRRGRRARLVAAIGLAGAAAIAIVIASLTSGPPTAGPLVPRPVAVAPPAPAAAPPAPAAAPPAPAAAPPPVVVAPPVAEAPPVAVAPPVMAPEPPAPPAATPSPTKVQVSRRIVSQPPGAHVFRVDGRLETDLGRTPLVLSVDEGAPPVKVRIVLEGHVSQVRTIATDRSDDVRVSMPRRHRDPLPEL